MSLAEFLSGRRDEIIRRWTEAVSGDLHPAMMPRPELIDHLPVFLDEIAEALRMSEAPEKSQIAESHGIQRLSLGFNVDGVIREYGVLRDAVIQEAAAAGVEVSTEEREILISCVITGIAGAISEYQRQRDAELQRHMNEHFAFIAHELRNPLGTALTAFHLLRSGNKIADERLGAALDRGLNRMHDLIEHSLRLAQVGSGVTIQREKMALRSLLEDAEMAATASAEAKGVTLSLNLEQNVEICVDARLVRSALTNLVSNAVKFTHEGSRVEVRARVEGSSPPRLVIEVEDRCGGLADGDVERTFDPFVQAGNDRSGFGLGLAISKQAASAHGGTIRVQNLPGEGCIFILELPSAMT